MLIEIILSIITPNTPLMKKFLLTAVLLLALSASCFADAILFAVKSTPYDKQMSRIRPVLLTSGPAVGRDLSLGVVNEWMGGLRAIPYGFTPAWKTPAETNSGAPADCKAKALALYEKMRAHGATDVRLVIGRRTTTSRQTHAWLSWETSGGSYVLDPTFNYAACKSARLGGRSYVPFYAYADKQKYRAAATLVAQN